MRIVRIYEANCIIDRNFFSNGVRCPPLSIDLPHTKPERDHLTPSDRQSVIASGLCYAAHWLLHCALLGNAHAQTNYANMLSADKGVAQNHANALEWHRRAEGLEHAPFFALQQKNALQSQMTTIRI